MPPLGAHPAPGWASGASPDTAKPARNVRTGVRDTSVKAYRDHESSGKLSRQEQQVYDHLTLNAHRDFTRSELAQVLRLQLSAICGRVNALIGKKLLTDEQKRVCGVTGKTVHAVKVA